MGRIETEDLTNAPKCEGTTGSLLPEPCFRLTKEPLLAGRLGERESLIGLDSFRQDGEHDASSGSAGVALR